jgi:hypothetical protein
MSALDHPIRLTVFPNRGGRELYEVTISLRNLAARAAEPAGAEKSKLPLIKLAVFGDSRTDQNCLRHDDNVLETTGIEADYDGEVIPPELMVEVLERAGIAALVYTTPSHTPTRPRWRALAPFARPRPPAFRNVALDRLHGLIDFDFGPESWTLS